MEPTQTHWNYFFSLLSFFFFFSPPARTTSCSPCRRGFEGGHKSILALLLAINCALKFYSVFMICRQRVIYVDGVSHPL